MSVEAKVFTSEQLKYQRLFDVQPRGVVAHEQANGLEKAGADATTLVVGLAADLVESHVVHHVEHATFGRWIHDLKESPIENESKLKKAQGLLGAFKFVEEFASDNAYSAAMNAWLRNKTGVEDATYASEAATFASEWSNAIAQVFFKNRLFGFVEKDRTTKRPITNNKGEMSPKTKLNGWIILAHPMENCINPVTVEASLRLVERVPFVGGVVGWGKEKLNHALEHSASIKYGNSIAAKAVTGYHIMANIAPVG